MLLKLEEVVEWDRERWPNFTPRELACLCKLCGGELYYDEASFDAIQSMRKHIGAPLEINSAHRCQAHNKLVGGVRLSKHLQIAFDVSTEGHGRQDMLEAAKTAGFTGVGMYSTFMHVDLGRKRHWFGGGSSAQLWMPIINKVGL